MKKALLLFWLAIAAMSLSAQKVPVKLLMTKNAGQSDWQILDDQNISVISGAVSPGSDSLMYNLNPNKYYFLRISVTSVSSPDTSLYTLYINDEPILLINSGIGTGDHLFPFFTGTKALNAKITGGTTALISDFPWQVYYISGDFRCGGSIINGNWVVTAAHCTKNSTGGAISASEMFVRVGANNPSNLSEGKTYAVSAAVVHEAYDDGTLLNDIALLKLKDTINFSNATPINLVTPADVSAGAIVPGVLSWVTGWGLTSVSPKVIPSSLQKVQLPVISNAQAASVWGSSITATDLMAGYLNGNKDACNGDSGGPMVVPVSGENRLAGIVSWGSSQCNTYGAYTRVSDFNTWILKSTGFLPKGDSIVCKGVTSSQYTINPVPGATAYQWIMSPSTAGTITGNGKTASILWNSGYTGKVTLIVRATAYSKIEDWYRLSVRVAAPTVILSQSSDTVICAGKPVTLTVKTTGYNQMYKWTKNGQVVQNEAFPALTISSSTVDDSGNYQCQVTGACGSALSSPVKLTVYPVTKITSVSPDIEAPFGSEVTLQVAADGHDLIYEWQKNGSPVSNSNSSVFVLSGTNASNIGIYRSKVTGTCGVEISDSIYVYVKRADFTSDPEVFLWPSITSSEFAVALSKDTEYSIQIYSTTGRKIREMLNCRYQTNVNISTLPKGVYIIEVFTSGFRKSIKVIKD
jgi:secreted trypsin-like serine protease